MSATARTILSGQLRACRVLRRPGRLERIRQAVPLQLIALVLVAWLILSVRTAQPQVSPARQHATEGLALARSGKLKEAELELRRAVKLDPQSAAYLAELGGILGMERDLKGAGICFQKALSLDPGNLIIRRNLAANEWQLGELEPARKNLEQVLRREPQDTPTILLLGMVEANLKDYAEGARLLGSVSDLADQHPQSLAALARCYYHDRERERARGVLMNLVSRFPAPQSVFLAGEMAEEAGDGATAEKFFKAIQTTYPDQPRLAYHLAHAAYLAENWSDCQRILLQLTNSGYRTSEAYDLLGESYARQNKMREAAKAFESAISLSPSSDSNYLELARTLTEHHLRDTAIQVLTSCVQALPQSFGCYEAKGKAESFQHYYKESTSSFRQAVRLAPASADAEAGLAASLAGLGKIPQAAAAYEAVIRLAPHRAEFYREYSEVLITEAGRNNHALQSRAALLLEKSISLNPSDGEARLLLGQLRLDQGKAASALPLLLAAARLDPQNARPHYLLWRAYQRLDRKSMADAELNTFKKLSLGRHEPKAR